MNVASAIQARFSALLVENDRGIGLEGVLRDQGCGVRRVPLRGIAQDAFDGTDIIVIMASGAPEQEVLDLVDRARGRSVLVVAETTEVAVKAAKHGASTVVGAAIELCAAQIQQMLALVELRRKVRSSGSLSMGGTTNGVVQRRSTPLPKEATPDALEALIEAAECLVPMHRFQRVYVDYALRRFGGNKVHTAAALGIDRRTIQRWARARAEAPVAAPNAPTTTSTTTS